MTNVLMQLIQAGRIQTLDGLKGAYRNAIMKTHPDAVGSNKYLESYLELRNQYEEAKAYLAKSRPLEGNSEKDDKRNHRLEFFEKLNQIESLETPYAFHPEENIETLLTTNPDFSVRRERRVVSSGCESRPATVAPAGST
jgi:hypothetical protein